MESKPLNILYVEDDRDLVMLVKERLAQAGFVVDAAYDGEEALAKYAGGFLRSPGNRSDVASCSTASAYCGPSLPMAPCRQP